MAAASFQARPSHGCTASLPSAAAPNLRRAGKGGAEVVCAGCTGSTGALCPPLHISRAVSNALQRAESKALQHGVHVRVPPRPRPRTPRPSWIPCPMLRLT